MNKELFVSSTPHETKVGLVEDDLLAEIYLERENEYTLAGSIYKGRVTRVLPGMQSAFVDIGLERDAFLYVSDFMDLEEHDDDLTDVVPTSRGVQDLRSQPRPEAAQGSSESIEQVPASESYSPSEGEEISADTDDEGQQASAATETSEPGNGAEPQSRDRGWRGRRRRRGGRRDRNLDRAPEPRSTRPAESAPSRSAGPPAGYEPILLPGESISKYRRYSQQASTPGVVPTETATEPVAEGTSAIASSFPEDSPFLLPPTSILNRCTRSTRTSKLRRKRPCVRQVRRRIGVANSVSRRKNRKKSMRQFHNGIRSLQSSRNSQLPKSRRVRHRMREK